MIINSRVKLKLINFIHEYCYPCIFNEHGKNNYEDYIKYIDDMNSIIDTILSLNDSGDMQNLLKKLNEQIMQSCLIFRNTPFNFNIFFDYSVNNDVVKVQDYFFTRYYKKSLYMFKIKKTDFNKFKDLAKKYGFKGLSITNKIGKISSNVYARIKQTLEKLATYLDITYYSAIGNNLLLKLQDNSSIYSGSFNYEDNSFADSGSITLCVSKNQKNFVLFRTLLHEYIHYIDFKIGEKIKKVFYKTKDKGVFFSELSSYNKSFFPHISLKYATILNHNLNNNTGIELITNLHKKDCHYLVEFLRKEGVEDYEFFTKRYAKQFSDFLDFVNKVYDSDICYGFNTSNSIDYFLNSIDTWKSKQLKKHTFIIKLSKVINSNNIRDTLDKIGVFDKKSYVRLREKHYSNDFFIRDPTLFKCSIGCSGMAKYLKRNSEMLAWSLTGGLNLYKEYNHTAIKDLYRLMNNDIISLRYGKISQIDNKKQLKDHIIELFNVFSFEYDIFRKIK